MTALSKASQPNTSVDRIWGSFEIIYDSPTHVVKILHVKPHRALSLQYHQYRDEFWTPQAPTVANIGGVWQELRPGNTYAIHRKEVHRLMNTSDKVLHVVEVIRGDYNENDIVRIDSESRVSHIHWRLQ